MYKEISANNLKENLDKEPQSIVIDVRTLGELQSGVVPGAIHIDLFGPGFLEQIKVLDKDATYYIICRSGNRSDSVAGAMDHMGFKDVYNVLGGMNYWNGELQFPQREVQSKTA